MHSHDHIAADGAVAPLKRAIRLHRLSTSDQLNRSGLERQRTATQQILDLNGFEVVATIELIDVSGSSVLLAPEMQRLLKMVEDREAEYVCISEVSRLVRPDSLESMGLLDVFIRTGCKIAVPGSIIRMDTAEG